VPGGGTVAIARAPEEEASSADFSLICFCFSSSLASIGTRSSGMGLLSYIGLLGHTMMKIRKHKEAECAP
jgi:hypothetical protein